MAELLPAALGWIDAQKRTLLQQLVGAMSDPSGAAAAFLRPDREAFTETPQQLVGSATSVMPEVASPALGRLTEIAARGMEAPGMPREGKLVGPALEHYEWLVAKGHTPADAYELSRAWARGVGLPAQEGTFSSKTFDALQAQHGLDEPNVKAIQRYTGETAEQILARFNAAQDAFAQLYKMEGTTSAQRAAQQGFGDIANHENWLWRGSQTPRAELLPPVETGAKASGAPEAVFGSFPGETVLAKSYGPTKTPLVSTLRKEDFFDVLNPEHLESLPERGAGLPIPYGERNWTALESPNFIEALKNAQWPGFLTDEGSSLNFGTFRPEAFRHPLAAFDPTKRTSRNIFADFAPIGMLSTLAAALAGQGLPVDSSQ